MSDKNEHTNEIAIKILRDEYADYDHNWWHYNSEYKMLLEAQTQAWKQANEAADMNEKALNLPVVNNQRELLKYFAEEWNKNGFNLISDCHINDFLKRFL